ncbi:hypothetical protein XENORESO_005085 [Xenotaenia resolanae]|uniref:Uncharacterized protein n=1 Tax=Xenotaenia resolanae TaxID=208358 RepID=A0ABV0WZY5_9TELE
MCSVLQLCRDKKKKNATMCCLVDSSQRGLEISRGADSSVVWSVIEKKRARERGWKRKARGQYGPGDFSLFFSSLSSLSGPVAYLSSQPAVRRRSPFASLHLSLPHHLFSFSPSSHPLSLSLSLPFSFSPYQSRGEPAEIKCSLYKPKHIM